MHFAGLQSQNIFGKYKSKVVYYKKLVFRSGVVFLIWFILDYVQHHLVDFWKKRPANFNLIWLEWNSYNSSIQFHIVWSRSSIFKLKSSQAQGWCLSTVKVLLNKTPLLDKLWSVKVHKSVNFSRFRLLQILVN